MSAKPGSRPLTLAFVLLSYTEDAPAGLERSVAALQQGLRELGHRALIVTAAGKADGADPDLLPLTSVAVPDPATEHDLLAVLADPAPACAELTQLLAREQAGIVCWADASWGLGYLAPAPPGVRTALSAAVMRTDALFRQALARRPDVVITNSAFMIGEAADAGYDTSIWVRSSATYCDRCGCAVAAPGRQLARRHQPFNALAPSASA